MNTDKLKGSKAPEVEMVDSGGEKQVINADSWG